MGTLTRRVVVRKLLLLSGSSLANPPLVAQLRFSSKEMLPGLKSLTVDANLLDSLGLVLLSISSSEFPHELSKLLTKNQQSDLTSLLPESVILCNRSQRYIWGFVLIHRYPDKLTRSGNPVEHQYAISPGGAASRTRMLVPGGTYLSTPISGLAASSSSGEGSSLPYPPPDDLKKMLNDHRVNADVFGDRVRVILDAVIFEDGEIVGPDTTLRMKTYNDRIRAHEHFVSLVFGLEGDALKAKLVEIDKMDTSDEYSFELCAIGTLFLAMLNQQGQPVAQAAISRMKTTPWFSPKNRVWRQK